MQATRSPRKSMSTPSLPDNALAKKVLEEIEKIDAEAKQKKLAQLDSLETAKQNILQRIRELQHQLGHIEKAMEIINDGKVVRSKPEKIEKRGRRNLDEIRDRVCRWMESHKGEKYAARDLVREFNELRDVPMSYLLKPLVQSGKIKTDLSEGPKRPKYFVAEGCKEQTCA